MSEEPLTPGQHYLISSGRKPSVPPVAQPKHRVDVNTLKQLAAKSLSLNEIGVVTITTDRRIPFDPYAENRDMGGFILIDRLSNATVGAGLLHFALRRSQNVHWQAIEVDKAGRSALNAHGPASSGLTGVRARESRRSRTCWRSDSMPRARVVPARRRQRSAWAE